MSSNLCHPDSTLLRVTLSRLQCPYQVEGDQALCSFYQREAYCPFVHRSDQTTCSTIPANICVDHLVGKCMAEDTWKVPINDDWLARCSAGYHPTWIQMIDLEQMQKALQDQVQVEDDLKCAICLEQMHYPLGLLKRCRHVFCGECIVVWRETDPQMRCPVCRVHSQRMLLLTDIEPIWNEGFKRKLFRLQARCINLEIRWLRQTRRRLTRAADQLQELLDDMANDYM